MDHTEICRSLGRIEGTLAEMKPKLDDVHAGVSDYRAWKNRIIGVCVVSSAVFGTIWSYVMKKV